MNQNPLVELHEYGQSFWLDDINRPLITSGELERLVEADGLRGVPSKTAIFEKAILNFRFQIIFLKSRSFTQLYAGTVLALSFLSSKA